MAMKKVEAKLHFCSRSLIIEPIQTVTGADHSMSLFKYLFRNFVKEPQLNSKLETTLTDLLVNQKDTNVSLAVTKLIEIPCHGAPKAYKMH
jgi:hypothetical protein